MPNRTEQLQQIFAHYRDEFGVTGPTILRDVAQWALGAIFGSRNQGRS